jgi:acyl-CoA synthetase (NDP forming)
MTEFAAKTLLREHGVAAPAGREVGSPDEAADAAAELGFPIALKVSHPDLAHKSDVGGVALGVANAAAAREAAARLLALRAGARVLVEELAPDGGLDLLVGFRRDPVFGPVFLAGLGGVYAEIFADASLHVGPPTADEARAMLTRLRGYGLLAGARGGAALDVAAAVRALLALAEIARRRPEICEFDINPLRVYRRGALALDALAVRGAAAPAADEREAFPGDDRRGIPHAVDAERARLNSLFRPAAVAVAGASTTAEKAGNIIIKNLRTFGYAGAVYPVNPAGGAIEGLPAYTSVAACPRPVELVVAAVPHRQVEAVIEDAAAAGARYAIVVSGGFGDAGPEGRRREARLVELCARRGIRLMGPNSIGTIDAVFGFCVSIGKLPPMPPTGVSLLGQTGTFSTGFSLEEITRRRRGFSKVACLGNKADADESDFLAYYGDDPDTRCIGMYLEGVNDGRRFLRAARRAAGRKPVVALKSGRTELGARAAASHTGALAGSDAVYDAVFRQTGIHRVDDFGDFFAVLRAFDLCPLPRGWRVGVVSITGVGCVLAADACGEFGLELAAIGPATQARFRELAPDWATVGNPADIWSTIERLGPLDAYGKMCAAMIADDAVDILLVVAVLLEEGRFDAAAAIAPALAAHPGKPVLACALGGRDELLAEFQLGLELSGAPVFSGPRQALLAASHLCRRAETAKR